MPTLLICPKLNLPGAPIYSYSKRTYDGYIGQAAAANIRGRLVSLKINVTKPYTGTQPSLIFKPMGRSGSNTIKPDDSAMRYDPSINLKVAGERDVFPRVVVGQQSGDSNLSIPGPIWFAESYAPYMATDISGENPGTWPTVTIEITTDQSEDAGRRSPLAKLPGNKSSDMPSKLDKVASTHN